MPQHHHFRFIERGKPDANGRVVSKKLVAMQLNKLVKYQCQIIDGVRSIFVPGDLNRLPRRQVFVDLAGFVGQLFFQLPQILVGFCGRLGRLLEVLNLGGNVGERLFEFEVVHGVGFRYLMLRNSPAK